MASVLFDNTPLQVLVPGTVASISKQVPYYASTQQLDGSKGLPKLHQVESLRMNLLSIQTRHSTRSYTLWSSRKDVDAFKDPLAQTDSGSEASDDEGTAPKDPTTLTVIEDTTMLYKVHFTQPQRAAKLSCISPQYIATLTAFVRCEFPPTRLDEDRVRRCVLHAQNQVEKVMEEDFEAFSKSELLGSKGKNNRKEAVWDIVGPKHGTQAFVSAPAPQARAAPRIWAENIYDAQDVLPQYKPFWRRRFLGRYHDLYY